jgi:hypothetical protein
MKLLTVPDEAVQGSRLRRSQGAEIETALAVHMKAKIHWTGAFDCPSLLS